jgi:MoaA/NifB/PqqE/SkfB family radical SAM enzyme
MLTNRGEAAAGLTRKRYRQLALSFPRYLREVAQLRTPRQLYRWFYYKLPYTLPLIAFPASVNLELTTDCNLRCPHCPRPLAVKQRGIGQMDPELFAPIVREIAKHRECVLKIVGLGEPALHKDLAALMEQVANHRIRCLLYTNGELFKRFTPEQITRWNIETLIVSIDGLDAASFNRIRAGADYHEVSESMKQFFQARERLGVRRPEIEVRHVIFPNETPADLLRFRTKWLAVSDTVKFNYLYFPTVPKEAVRTTRCRDIRREFYVYWDGRVPLCSMQYIANANEWLGNVRDSTITELWNHPRLNQVRELHGRRELDNVPFCRTCTFK